MWKNIFTSVDELKEKERAFTLDQDGGLIVSYEAIANSAGMKRQLDAVRDMDARRHRSNQAVLELTTSKGKRRKALSEYKMKNNLILSGNENAWSKISQQKAEIASLKKQVESLTKERDLYLNILRKPNVMNTHGDKIE